MSFRDTGEFTRHSSDTRDKPKKISELMLATREQGHDFVHEGETAEGKFIVFSSTGSKRKHNEDALGVLPERGLFIVADGMGGVDAGEEASRIVVQGMEEIDKAGEDFRSKKTLEQLQAELNNFADNNSYEESGMGTTVAAFKIVEGKLETMHAGDCRIYVYSSTGELKYISKDHSLIQADIDQQVSNKKTVAEIEKNEETFLWKNIIKNGIILDAETRSFFSSELAKVNDQLKQITPEGRIMDNKIEPVEEVKLEAGDIVVACSDGLNDMMPQSVIDGIVQSNWGDLKTMQEIFLQEALNGGGEDNISLVIYQHGK